MVLQLTVETSGDSLSRFTYAFDQDEVTLGRSALCDVQLPFPSISTQHLRFFRQDRAWSVQDEGSTNGARLNQAPLPPREPRALRDGDVILLEGAALHVQLPEQAQGALTTSLRSGELARHLLALGAPDAQAQRASLEVLEGLDLGARAALPHEGGFVIAERGDWSLREPALRGEALRIHLTREGYELALPPGLRAALDGQPCADGAVVLLRSGHRVRVGGTTLLFLDPLQTRLDALEEAPKTPSAPATPAREATPARQPWGALDVGLAVGAVAAAVGAVVLLLLVLGVL